MATDITTQPFVETETFNCPKCGTVLTIPSSICEVGGVVNCTQCGTSFRRLARPGYFGRYVDASTNRKYRKNTDYYYYLENEDEYRAVEVKSSAEFKAAVANYGKLYKLIAWEAKSTFTEIKKPTALKGYETEIEQFQLDGKCYFNTGVPPCKNLHLFVRMLWGGVPVAGEDGITLFDTKFSQTDDGTSNNYECLIYADESTATPGSYRLVLFIHGKKVGISKPIPINQWFDLEISIHNGVMRVFLNNEEIASPTIPEAPLDTVEPIIFGMGTRRIDMGYHRDIDSGFNGIFKKIIIGDTDGGPEYEFYPVISAGKLCIFSKKQHVAIPNSGSGSIIPGSVVNYHDTDK